jgi:hypothetical protein
MAAVREDVRPARRSLLDRMRLVPLGSFRPQIAMAAAILLALGVLLGTQLTGGDGHRVVTGVVDRSRVPEATATLTLPDDKNGPAQLRVTGMPAPKPGQVYEIWLKRGDQLQPAALFNTDQTGSGAGAIPDDLEGVSAVLVTREATGGAKMPSEAPIISARI